MSTPMITPTTPVPRINLPDPHMRRPSLSSTVAQADSLRNSRVTHIPVPAIPKEHQQNRSASSDRQTGQAVTSDSPIHTPVYSPFPSSVAQRYTPQQKQKACSPHSKSKDSGYTSGGSSDAKSPVVPMRSMFPVYNPQVSLAQQQYYPQRPLGVRTNSLQSRMHRVEYPPSSTAWTPIDRALGPPSAPATIANFPLDALSPHISSPKDLIELWDATHGMEPNPKIKSYDLELARTEEAKFTIGSDPTAPFYSLITYDTNEIALTKTNPRKQAVQCEVSVNSIEPPARRTPANDGLVTFIFPKMAAMLAINQSTVLAKQHGLAPTHRDEVQAAAVKRAASQEACKLRWNAIAQHYEIEHPAVGRRQRETTFAKSPDSARSPPESAARPVLEIHVSKSVGRSLPIISVANPKADIESGSEPTVPGIRLSTIPQSEHDNALVSLDFNTRIMHVNANQILEHVPSLFAIDSIISAVMTVAIADEVANPVMAAMELWQPKPTRAISTYGGSVAGKSTTGSVFYATLAEREEAEEEAKALAAIHERDIKNKERRKEHRKWFGKSKSEKKSKSKTKKVTVTEFDLEKLGQYQSGEREGQKLPGPIRAMLSVMVGGLRFVVWLLTAIVQVFAWLLVTCTRCTTSEKF